MKYPIEEIKKNIIKDTTAVFSKNKNFKLKESVDLLIDFIKFPLNNSTQIEGIETRMLNAFNKVLGEEGEGNRISRETFFADFAKIEPFLRKVLFIRNPSGYASVSNEALGLMTFIKELGLNPSNLDLNKIDIRSYQDNPIYIDHLARVYQFKNKESHFIRTLSIKEYGELVESFLVIYMYVTDKFKLDLSRAINISISIKEPIFNSYCNTIIQEFKERMSRFIHLSSKEDITLAGSFVSEYKLSENPNMSSNVREGSVDELRLNINENRMMIWGSAGMGKTTTLEYLAYQDAKKKQSNSQGPLPVFVQLGLLIDNAISLKQYIHTKIQVDSTTCERMLEEGKINLFLDGLNEIPKDFNNQLRTLRQREIGDIMKSFKKSLIIITNRPQNVNLYPDVPVFFIQKMNDGQIKDFVKKYSDGNKSVENKIQNAIELDDRLKRIINSPLMLSRLIEIVKQDGEIPSNEGQIIDRFLKSLYRREIVEKKDANFNEDCIHKILSYLGYYSVEEKETNAALSENEVLNIFKRCKKDYGYEIDLGYVLDVTTQLNILEKRDNKYIFSHQSYQDYFCAEFEKIVIGI